MTSSGVRVCVGGPRAATLVQALVARNGGGGADREPLLGGDGRGASHAAEEDVFVVEHCRGSTYTLVPTQNDGDAFLATMFVVGDEDDKNEETLATEFFFVQKQRGACGECIVVRVGAQNPAHHHDSRLRLVTVPCVSELQAAVTDELRDTYHRAMMQVGIF